MKTPAYIEPMLLAAQPYTLSGNRDSAATVAWEVARALDAAGYEIKRRPLPNGEYQKIGALARAKSLSPERRSEIARNAARARWDKSS